MTDLRALFVRLFLALFAVAINVDAEAAGAKKCSDIFSEVSKEVAGEDSYNRDFGAGVFVKRVRATEFHIEPPPVMVKSVRDAQRQIGNVARNNGGEKFTVMFLGLSEAEVLGWKAMLQRDARLESDDRLSTVLLGTETVGPGENFRYEHIREKAILARDRLLRRYDWTKAIVSQEGISAKHRQEVYRLSVDRSKESESFLLTFKLRAQKYLKNRTSQIAMLLSSPTLNNATPEQLAHTLISDLKKSDNGISAGTLKVMAGDFLIAQAIQIKPV